MEKNIVFRTGRRLVLMMLLMFSAGPNVLAQTLQTDSQVLRQLMEKIKLDGLKSCIEDAPAPHILTEPRFTQGTSNVIGIVLPNLDTTVFDPTNIKEPFIITNVSNSTGTQVLPFPRPVTFPSNGNTQETVGALQNGITYFYSTALFLPVCLVNCDAVVDTSQLEIHCSPFSDTTMSIQDTEAPVVQNMEIPQLATSAVTGWLNQSSFAIHAGLSDHAGVWQGFLYRRECSQNNWNLVADTTFAGTLTSAGYVFEETAATRFVQNLADGCYEFRVEGKDATHTPESFFPNFQLAGNGGIPADNAAAQLKIQIDTTPPQPVDLTCRQEQNAIFLEWSVSVDPAPGIGLKGYRILKDKVLIATVAGTDSIFMDDFTDVDTKGSFTYQVQPLDSLGNVQTSGGQAECIFDPRSKVRMLPEPEFTSGNRNEICWTRASNIDSVTLFRAENYDFQNAAQVQVKDTCFTFTALKDGVQYCYWLTSTDRFGRAVLSDTVTSIQDATPPILTEFDLPEKVTLREQIWVNRKSVQLRLAAKETAPGQYREIVIFEDENLGRKIDVAGLHGALDSTFAYTLQANECVPVNLTAQIFDLAGNASNLMRVPLRIDATPPAEISDATCFQLQNVNGIHIQWSPVSDGENCSGLAGYRILRNSNLIAEVAVTETQYDDMFSEQQSSTAFMYQVQPFDSVGNIQQSGGQAECDYQGLTMITIASLPEFLPGLESDICWSISGSLANLQLFRNEGTGFMKSDSFVVESSTFANGCRHFSNLKDGRTYFYWLKGTDAQARVTFSDTVFTTQDATLPVVDDLSLPAGELVNNQIWTYSRDIELSIAAHDVPPGKVRQVQIFENGQPAAGIDFNDPFQQSVQRISYSLSSSIVQTTKINLQVVVVDGAGNRSLPKELELYLQENAAAMFAFPNPFNPETGNMTIRLADTAENEVKIYDFFGNLVQTLNQKAGSHDFLWNGRNGNGEMVANGGYVCIGTKTHQRFKIGVVKRRFVN